jgi:hypothetical protein
MGSRPLGADSRGGSGRPRETFRHCSQSYQVFTWKIIMLLFKITPDRAGKPFPFRWHGRISEKIS